MKHKVNFTQGELIEVPFSVLPVGDKVVLLARLDRETFESICAFGAETEDHEDDGSAEPSLGWPEKDSQYSIQWTSVKDESS